MVENSSSNSYAKTNSLLFDTLERGIKQEQANIELLTKKEKNIKSIITEEEKKNSKNNLPQVRKELERKLLFLKEELIKIKSKLKRKEDIFRHSQQTLSALKLERTMQYSKQNKLINDLEDKLQQLLNQKNNETKILLKEKEKHNAHINGIVKEKENIQRLIKLQEKSIDGSLKKDKLDQEKKVSIIEGELEGLTNKKRKITSEADLRSQALRLNIKKIKEIQGVVQEHFQKLEEHLAKKDFNFNDPIFAELIKEWRLRLGYFQETENKLEEVIKKKEISIKNSLKNMELKIVNLQTEKKRINDQYLNNQQKLAELSNLSHEEQELVRILEGQKKRLEYLKQQIEREKDKEHSLSKIIDLEKKQIYGQKLWQQRNFNREEENIANIKAVYDKQHHQLLKQNTSLDKELKEIQFQKEEAQRDFEKNRASLNKLTAELQELEQQLFLREKSSQEKTRMLLNEINLRQKEVQISEGKLKKMDVLINTVKRMSVESPEVLDSFKKEQKKIKLELNNLDINIINKKHEVEAINRLLENHKNIFLTKKNNILKMQERASKEQKQSTQLLTKINKEIKKHNQELEKNKGQIEEISETEQKQVLAKKASLQKKAEEFNQLLLSKEEDYKTSLTAQKNTKKLVNELSAKAEKYSQQLHIQSNALSRQRQALSKRKLLQQALAEEEILLQQIKEKINTETQNISKLRHSENQLNTAVEKQKISFSEQLVQTIEQFKSKLELEGKKKLESLAKVIEDERKKSVILHNESKNKERMIEEEITAQEAKLQEFRKRAAVDFSQLKEDRLRTIREGMDRKLKQLNQDIKTEEEELQELKIRLQKEEMVLKEKIISKKNEFEEEKTLLQNKIGLINSKTASSNLAIREVQARMKELNEKSSSLSSRISSAQDKKKVMEERLNRHDKDLLALNDIVKRKLHSINEIKILKEEIKQLHLILNNKLRKGKVKLNIIKLIKTVPVRSAQEMKPALKTIDELLGKLPAEEIDDFAKSKEFTTYKKIMNKYGVK